MTASEIEVQFWMTARLLPLAPYSSFAVVITPWLVVVPVVGMLACLRISETRWLLRQSRATAIWFWATYVGSAAVLGAHAVFGASAKFTINAFAVPLLVTSVLFMMFLWVTTWIRLGETYASQVLQEDAAGQAMRLRRSPRS